MNEIQHIFSNREISTIVWLLLIILGFQFNKSIRQSTQRLFKAFFVKSIVITNLLAIIYSSSIVYILYQINFWDNSLLKDSIYWFIGSGFLILLNLNKTDKEQGFFKSIVQDNLKLILVLEFTVNLHQFNLLTELILLPILVLFGMLQVLADREKETKNIASLIDWLFAIFGFLILGVSINDIWVDYTTFANTSNIKSFLIPIILSISFIPYAYLIALIMKFEVLFIRLGFFLPNKDSLRYAKWRVFLKSRFSLRKLRSISTEINKLYYGSTKEEIKNTIK